MTIGDCRFPPAAPYNVPYNTTRFENGILYWKMTISEYAANDGVF
jgi:hypothetical protein